MKTKKLCAPVEWHTAGAAGREGANEVPYRDPARQGDCSLVSIRSLCELLDRRLLRSWVAGEARLVQLPRLYYGSRAGADGLRRLSECEGIPLQVASRL